MKTMSDKCGGSEKRRLMLEELEERIAPAGNVTAFVSGGNFFVFGDSEDNDIIVDQWGLAEDEFVISSGSDATLVNGWSGAVLVQGVTGGFYAALGDGNDALSVLDATLSSATVDSGRGNDFVEFDQVEVEGSLTAVSADTSVVLLDGVSARSTRILGGRGADEVFVRDSCIWGNLNVIGRGGDSTTTIQDSCVVDNLVLRNGAGRDLFDLDGSVVFGSLVAVNGNGGSQTRIMNDSLVCGATTVVNAAGADTTVVNSSDLEGRVTIVNGVGDSNVSIAGAQIGISSFTGRLSDIAVRSGNGADEVFISDSTVGRHLNLSHGGGGSLTWLEGLTVGGNLSLRAASGSDDVVMEFSSVYGATSVTTGTGDDVLWADDSVFEGRCLINAGHGNDAIVIDTLVDEGYEQPTIFGSVALLAGGAGDDRFFLGSLESEGAYGRFEGPLVVSGGGGYDYLDALENGNLFLSAALDVGVEEVV